ncbi:hypothetical protein [Lysobacter gummosus]
MEWERAVIAGISANGWRRAMRIQAASRSSKATPRCANRCDPRTPVR